MHYTRLKAELAKPEYAELSDVDAADRLNESSTETEVVSTFASFRTIAGLVSDQEYAALRQALAVVAEESPKIADMVEMLELPGDNRGGGGGIDFGAAATRAAIEALFPDPLKRTLLAIAERTKITFRWQSLLLGEPATAYHVARARSLDA